MYNSAKARNGGECAQTATCRLEAGEGEVKSGDEFISGS